MEQPQLGETPPEETAKSVESQEAVELRYQWHKLYRYSSISKLLRVSAYCLRFIVKIMVSISNKRQATRKTLMSILDNYVKSKSKSGNINGLEKSLSGINLTISRYFEFKLISLRLMRLDQEETSMLLSPAELNRSRLFITYLHQEMYFSSLKSFLRTNHKLKKRLPNQFIKLNSFLDNTVLQKKMTKMLAI